MGTWSTQQPSLQNFCITAWSLIWEYYLRKTYTTALLLDYEWLRWCKKKREKDPNYSKPSFVTEVTFLKNPTVKETAICKCQTLWEKQCQKNQRHNTIICKFLINKHTNICVDVCRNESCQGDQTMLGAWQSDTQKIWREKTLHVIALSFSACPYTPPCVVPWDPPCLSYSHTHKVLSIFRT